MVAADGWYSYEPVGIYWGRVRHMTSLSQVRLDSKRVHLAAPYKKFTIF